MLRARQLEMSATRVVKIVFGTRNVTTSSAKWRDGRGA
jgi:hypothetical protein